jgi:transcriptional regulator of met regulon
MNDGIKILLARMESHPEELNRWEQLFSNYKKYLSQEDRDSFWNKVCEIKQQEFNAKVMKTLLADKEEKERKKLSNIQQIVEQGLTEAFKEAYTNHTLDSLTYLIKDRLIFKDEK